MRCTAVPSNNAFEERVAKSAKAWRNAKKSKLQNANVDSQKSADTW